MFNWIRKPAKESRTIPECRRVFEIHMQWPVIAKHVKNRKRCRTATAARRAVTGAHCKSHKRRTTRHYVRSSAGSAGQVLGASAHEFLIERWISRALGIDQEDTGI